MENKRGIIFMLFAMLTFAIADSFIKAAENHLTTGQIIFYLGFGGTIAFALMARFKGQQPFPPIFFQPAIMLRNFGEVVGLIGIFNAIILTTLSITSAIQQIVPIVVTMGAALFLGEQVGWRRWTAIFAGFFFVLLIIRPGFDGFNSSATWALLGVAGLSLRDLATKRISRDISSIQLSVYAYVVLIPTGIALIYFQGNQLIPSLVGFAYMFGILVFSMIGYLTITISVRSGELSAIVPFRYTRIIFALFIGIVFFAERPDWQTLVGAAGIIASGLFLIIREKKT